MNALACIFVPGLAAALAGCGDGRRAVPAGTLVLTQIPWASSATHGPRDLLDVRYPAGSRVVLARPPLGPDNVRVLSRGLLSAGSPIVSPDGQRIFFAGKAGSSSAWQIYEAHLNGGRPRPATSMPDGAMDPALLPDGDLVFSSPVPTAADAWSSAHRSAIYAQSPRGTPRRLTFGTAGATDPTVLADGRILFVSAQPASMASAASPRALFTVNNDGTELTAYAGQHDGLGFIGRPRELFDGYVAFLASKTVSPGDSVWAENVRAARPFLSREKMFPTAFGACRSLEPGRPGELLAALKPNEPAGRVGQRHFAIFQIDRLSGMRRELLFDDAERDNLEAALVAPRSRPMGHLSNAGPTRTTGLLLCLDVNRTTTPEIDGKNATAAVRVRVLGVGDHETSRALAEIPVQADGSFLAEVPADVPLGFETLDARGQTLLRLPPSIWVRPGETRSCPGCHAPHGRALDNRRPLAVNEPPVRIGEPAKALAQRDPAR
ncbi:MAG: HzsA-related protein [Limisphaerales bacterium]